MAATVDALLQALLVKIRVHCDDIAQYELGGGYGRPWMIPPQNGWSGDPTEIEDLKEPFDRTDSNTEAVDVYTENRGIGEAAGREAEIGYMGMMERSFRDRHKTAVRAHLHAAGRRKAHGLVDGIHTGTMGVLSYIQGLLDSGEA